jgi:hypothetical protein
MRRFGGRSAFFICADKTSGHNQGDRPSLASTPAPAFMRCCIAASESFAASVDLPEILARDPWRCKLFIPSDRLSVPRQLDHEHDSPTAYVAQLRWTLPAFSDESRLAHAPARRGEVRRFSSMFMRGLKVYSKCSAG